VKKHILVHGGVASAMCLFPDFKDYFSQAVNNNSSMIYDIPYSTAAYLLTNGFAVGHAVFCTGWNDVEQYWMCKNSWGTSWAEGGYFKVWI
jgi:C1A family cysteine protease